MRVINAFALQAMRAVEGPLAETITATYRAEAARQARHATAVGSGESHLLQLGLHEEGHLLTSRRCTKGHHM